MFRKKWTEASAKSTLAPDGWLLENSSRPPPASVRMLTQLLWARISAGDAYVAVFQGLRAPARASAPAGAPAQVPFTCPQDRSPAMAVWLVPSTMSENRVVLLR